MKIAKKTLSVFLSVLMLITSCSVGIFGVSVFAADMPALFEEDGSYTASEVKSLLAAAATDYNASNVTQNSGNALIYTGDYSMLLAADALVSYAMQTYVSSYGGRVANNTGVTVANALISGLGITDGTQQAIIKTIFDPAGDTVFSYWGSLPTGSTDSSKYAWHSGSWYSGTSNRPTVGQELTTNSNVKWDTDSDENLSSCKETLTKTATIALSSSALNDYLLTFDSLEAVPKKIPTRVQFTFDYAREAYAVCTQRGNLVSNNKYVAYYWNYFSDVDSKIRAKNTKAKKQLESFVEYFDDEVLTLTFDQMLEMPAADLYNYYLVATQKVEAMETAGYNSAVLGHFLGTENGYTYADLTTYIDNLWDAYSINLIKNSIDVLDAQVGTDYSEMSYAQMAALYGAVNSANKVFKDVTNGKAEYQDAVNYIIANNQDYVDKYTDLAGVQAATDTYIDELYAAMRYQHLVELKANMTTMYNDYYEIACDTNNLEDITTTQLAAIVSKARGIDATLAGFTAAEKAQVLDADELAAWADLVEKLEAKLAVRDDEAVYDSYQDYFYPYLAQDYTDMSNEELIALHSNAATEYEALVVVYNTFVTEYGQEWTDALFTYTFNGKTDLLQNLLADNYTASNSALETYIKALNAQQLATVAACAGITTVDFTNYASLKSTLVHFDQDLYDYCLEQGWLSNTDTATYATIETLLASWTSFVSSDGYSAFDHDFAYADENGVYVTRYAGDQTTTDNEDNEVQLGYPSDIARDNEDKNNDGVADDNYTVTEDEIVETITKIDNFIVSRDFGALIGLEDEKGNATNLETYINDLFDTLFTDDMMTTLVTSIYPMLTDLLETQLGDLIAGLAKHPNPDRAASAYEENASGAYDELSTTLIGIDVTGVFNIYMDEDLYNHDGSLLHLQNEFPTVFADLGLHIYPSTLASFLADWDPGAFGPTTDIYKALTACGRDWSLFDATKDYEWGVYDSDSFIEGIGMILESILPLAQAAIGVDNLDVAAGDAAFIHGPIYLNEGKWYGTTNNVGAQGELTLRANNLGAYSKVLVPLFEVFRLDDYGYTLPTIEAEADGSEIANAVVGPILELLNQILDRPLTKILEILPNLVYFLSMNSVSELLSTLILELEIEISDVDIKTEYSGALGDIASALEGVLGGLISFSFDLDIGSLLNLDEMLGFNITDLNDIIKTVVGDSMTLPELDQTTIMFASDWNYQTSANGNQRINLTAHKADVLYALLSYVVKALGQEGFLDGLLGDSVDGAIKELINKIASNVYYNQDGALAAIMEILVPNTDANGEPEYELEEMDWVNPGEFNYGEIEGASQMSIVYLNYGNDWSREDAEYVIENVDEIVATILEMTGSDIESLNAYLAEAVNGIFTGDVITSLVKALGGFGDSPSAVLNDILSEQIGVDITVWFDAFGYLFPADTWKEDAVVIAPGAEGYSTTFENVTATADAEGNITWYYAGEAFVDGDKTAFINILCELVAELDVVIGFLLGGQDLKAFDSLLELKGYESYASTFGVLLETLGIENIPSQATVSADPINGLKLTLTAIADWFDALVESDNMIETVLEIIPDLFYYIESNGLGTLLHNLLMPVLVIVDDIRPLLDVNLNMVLSLIVSEFLNYGELDFNVILEFLAGVYTNDDLDYKWYNIDINNLTLSEVIKLVDVYLGTDLYNSGLVQIGVKGFCSGIEEYDSVSGTGYKTTVDAADALTLLLTAVIDCLSYPAQDKSKTNGDVILELIAEMTGNEDIAGIYDSVMEILAGIEHEYAFPNWGYMFTDPDATLTAELPEQSIVYLGYTTDWDEETADGVYDILDDVLDLVLPEVLEEGETIATLLNGLLEDNVYTDEILNTIVELLVNLLADFDATLLDLVDCVVSTDLGAWFTFCEEVTDDETGDTEWVCTYDWNIDAQETTEAKKDAFIKAIGEVLAPANELLSWLFFGTEYAFFTGSETDAEGNYVYNDLITLNGGEGYAFGLVYLFEALGCTMEPAANFYDEETDSYDVGAAVGSILNSVLALVDEISANPVEEVFNLLPNLIYFINADGAKVVVNNLLAPVNSILEKLTPVVGDISIGGLLEESVGFDISEIDMETLLTIATDNGVVLNDEMINILANLYVGQLAEFTSANGRTSYRLDVTGYEGDVLTIILSLALDLFNINSDLFSDLLGEDTYWSVYNLIKGASEEFTYRDLNWAYMYEGEDANEKLAALVAANGKLPERTNEAYDVYTLYQNNWNKHTADYVTEVLDTLVHDITTAVRSDGSSLGQILDSAIADGLYQDSILNSLIEMVVELLIDYEDLIAGAGALLGAESLADWFDYCEITTDENGDTVVTCTEDWGIDAAETIDEKREAFINSFAKVLEPAYDLLAWLFFAEDYTFFNGTTGDPLITIKGGRGYEEAFVPLFEAVGVLMKRDAEGNLLSVEETYLKGESAVLPATTFYVDGELDMEYAVKTIFSAVTDWLYDICGDLAAQGDDGALTSMLERLPNLIYSINADGLKVVVNNLVAPVMYLLDALEPMIGEIDFNELIGIEGMDIFDFDFDDLFALLADEDVLGLYFPDYTQEFLKSFYIGELKAYKSANGDTAYFMTYTEDETAAEMITCLIGFVVDAFQDPRNDECLIDWMGEDVYNGIMAVLGITEVKDMQEFDWQFTEYADTDKELNATETSIRYTKAYNNIWTRDKAEYIADNLIPFVSNILGLIGLEINGVEIRDIDDLLDTLLEGNLYTQATVDSLLETVRDLVANLTSLEPYGKYIVNVLDKAFGVNLAAWDSMSLDVIDGDRDSFVAALEEIVSPIVPLLNVLLCGENIELFYTIEPENIGKSALTIYGSEGYAYGIVPLFEALGCTMMAPEEFKALSNEDKVGVIINSLLDRVDVILQDPVNEIFAMLPELIYFINSNGLDTVVNNILNTVDTVLIALEPIVGETSLLKLLGVDLAEFDFDYIVNLAAEAIADSTGLEVETLILDFVAELTMGKVVTYQSANGETYYKMVYANEAQMADMVTVLLRLLIDWLATGNNADAIVALISQNSESEDAANSASTLIQLVLKGLDIEPATSGAMATLYYIFYGLNNGAAGLDELYGNYGDSWDSLVDFFEESDESYASKLVTLIKNIMAEFGGIDTDSSVDNCDCNCHNNSAFIRFFFKIINFLRKLFGMKEYQYCDCGVAHW